MDRRVALLAGLLFLSLAISLSAQPAIAKTEEGYQKLFLKMEKNPATAWSLSMGLPGLGHMYNEEIDKGLILIGVSSGILVLGSVMFVATHEPIVLLPCVLIYEGIGIYSGIEAARTAKAINQKIWPMSFLSDKGLQIALQLNPVRSGAGFNLNF